MKRLLHFLIRHRFLPRQKWFYRQVEIHLWRPADSRDAGQIDGWIEIGENASQRSVSHFRAWWESGHE